ncbi:MAG: hypothetical protein ABL977_00025 [Candidatus Eisenbacteria bacterium]
MCLLATPTFARVGPYARLAFGGDQLRMGEGNAFLQEVEQSFQSQGLAVDFDKVRMTTGPSLAAGLWLLPGFRVGATYAAGHSYTENRVHVPGFFFYAEDLDFRLEEVGAEAAITVDRWAGFTLGGHVARSRAKMVEGHTEQDFAGGSGDLFIDATAERTKLTYGAYVGIEQRNEHGIVGYLRAGYQFRDMGNMPSNLVVSDGFSSVPSTSTTIGLDFSGYYLRFGVGVDFRQ